MQRVLNRRVCGKCGLDYNLIFHRPANPEVCDVCGGALVARADDTAGALQSRLRDYHGKTKPILELFSRKELIVEVDGSRSTAEVQDRDSPPTRAGLSGAIGANKKGGEGHFLGVSTDVRHGSA